MPIVWAFALLAAVAFMVLVLANRQQAGRVAGWSLLGIFVVGVALALAASLESGDRAKAWGDLGRSFLVAGLLAFAVWLIGELRRPLEERSALQITLGLQQDIPGVDLHDKDLSGFDLTGRDLSGADLEGADLAEATLVEADLSGANLAGADLSGAHLKDADLSGADLSGAELIGAEAVRTNLHEARMPGADLSEAELSGANLKGACLAGGSLAGASLPDAHLEDAALTEADLEGARFWFDLRGAFLAGVGLDGAENAEEAHWPPGFADRVAALTAPEKGDPPAVVTAPRQQGGTGRVVAVFDGDTVLLATPNGQTRVRLSSIDAPDLGAAGGGAARDELRRLLPHDSPVSFAHDKRAADEFGRQLLYVFGDEGEMVNQLMVEHGVVVVRPDDASDEGVRNVRYMPQLEAAESWARQHALGLWTECPP